MTEVMHKFGALFLLALVALGLYYAILPSMTVNLPVVSSAPAAAQAITDDAYLDTLLNDHALQRHGVKAVLVEQAIQCQGSLFHMVNPFTGRSADICYIEERAYGISITEQDGSPVTLILKEKMRRLEQVVQYLLNRGYIVPDL